MSNPSYSRVKTSIVHRLVRNTLDRSLTKDLVGSELPIVTTTDSTIIKSDSITITCDQI